MSASNVVKAGRVDKNSALGYNKDGLCYRVLFEKEYCTLAIARE